MIADEQECNVKGSLRANLAFWEENLKPSSFVLNVVKHGYVLPLIGVPPIFYAKNMSAVKHADFVSEAIESLLQKGLLEELLGPAYCKTPLKVTDKGKLRLVLDLRHVNAFIRVKKFRYEDLKIVAELFEDNDYFVTFDLTSGYHHIDIHPDHHKYLGCH